LTSCSNTYALTSLTYEYDANGNLIQGDGKYYQYNDANQLIKVRHGDQNGPVIAEYYYDYTGQRIKKIENGVTTYYIGKHFETKVNGENEANTSYYFANGERVAKKDPSGNIYYYHSDHLGGTNVITDYIGNLIERIKYYPFGEIREGGDEKYSFTGKERDKLTDFYYFEARYYNPELKHFTRADTVEPDLYDPQDLNRYAYVRNNPVKFIDPSGHSKIGSEEWSQEYVRASKSDDKKKFEKMTDQLQAYQIKLNKQIKRYDKAINITEDIKTLADLYMFGLSVLGGPFGGMIGVGYDAMTMFPDIFNRYVLNTPTPQEIERDIGLISIKTFSHLSSSLGAKGSIDKLVYKYQISSMGKGMEHLWNEAQSNQNSLNITGSLNGIFYNQGGSIGISGAGVQPGQYLRLDVTIR
jgi:RHS repeat-associated protein